MRIGYYIHSFSSGGAEKVAAQLTKRWCSLGHEVVALTLKPEEEDEYSHECVARVCIPYQDITMDSAGAICREYCLDVLVFNDSIDDFNFEQVFTAFRAVVGLKIIVMIHHTANNWMYGTCNTRELFYDELMKKADAVVCVDKMWALWWKYRGVNSVFIQNPVSVEGERKEYSSPISYASYLTLVKNVDEAVEKLKGKRDIVWVGRLNDSLKRPELAIEVFAKLVREEMRAGERGMRFVMLGTCSKATEKYLRKLFSSLIHKNPASLTLPGFVTNVGDYLAKADALLFTSATEVTVPQTVREGCVSGVYTVAFDIPVLRNKGWEMEDEIKEKWQKVFAGERMNCDFDSPEIHQRLMDELHFSQQWFASHHLPDLLKYRKIRNRLDFMYLARRMIDKVREVFM